MPRTTNKQYIYRYVTVHVIWHKYVSYFRSLPLTAQRQLHDYFQPGLDLCSDDEVLAHRSKITLSRPALPQQAGRAYAHLMRIAEDGERERTRPGARVNMRSRSVSATSVRRDTPDTAALATALIHEALRHPERYR